MTDLLHQAFTALDAILATCLPPLAVIMLWGALAGVLAMLLYRSASDQNRIKQIKGELAELRSRVLSPTLSQPEVMQLSMRNLRGSVGLLGRVLGPSLLSVVPVLIVASGLQARYCCRAPAPGETVAIYHEPPETALHMRPAAISTSAGVSLVRYDAAQPHVSVGSDGAEAFRIDLRSPPTLPVTKPSLWTTLVTGQSLAANAAVEEVRVELHRREFITRGPQWLRGWEFPYFSAIFAVALALKLALRIE